MRGYLLAGAQIVLALLYIVLLGLDSVWTIGLVVACIALAQAPLTPTSDLLTTDAVREDPSLNYGRIRLWGSLAFLLCNIGAGYMLASTPADAVIIALILISLTAAAISIRAPRPRR